MISLFRAKDFKYESNEYCATLYLPFEIQNSLSVTAIIQWSGLQIEAFRRISNTHNQIAIQYKTQLILNNTPKTANCDLFPVPNWKFNFSSEARPSQQFYCSCEDVIGCQSKQCRYELNEQHQQLNFGKFCHGGESKDGIGFVGH